MPVDLLAPKFIALYVFIASAMYVHYRGRVRHGFLRQVTDHSTIMAPYNALMYLFSAVPNRPYVDVKQFPELAPLRDNWQLIRDEALSLFDEGHIRAAATYNDLGFNSFFKTGWKRFYVKWYDEPVPSARALCPKTVALVESIPSVNAAMFALLPPGSKLGAHRDPFAGSLRYHLGLVTPNNDTCRIVVDGEPYFWRDGEPVMFDETFIHTAENRSDITRIILFCDVERPLRLRIMRWLNHAMECTVIRASQTENKPGDGVGVLNHIFNYAYRVRLVGKWIKKKSRFAHYTLKWLLIGGLLYLIFR
ncbi:MAG TPA: aspartyl/asparaginyl beta-hydroxylase domain-containing protein [Casimicrobiaceae bacterium]|nr:aspartyl/asparaginyl beta-hydroxylase domain-containing protein [Casimicrobiaceae bacterium]